jgi:SM-20-related protein
MKDIWEQHIRGFTRDYSERFLWNSNSFLSPAQTALLLCEAKSIEKQGLFRLGNIGKGISKKRVPEIRSDTIYWLENYSSDAGALIYCIYEELQKIMRREFFLPSKRFECHYAKYETGAKYRKHRDRHKRRPGRLITIVIYLSDCPSTSGNLIVYDEKNQANRIQPKAGTIAVFDSSFLHEVLEAEEERWSLTGWLRDDLKPGILTK